MSRVSVWVSVVLVLVCVAMCQHHPTGKWTQMIPLGPYYPPPRYFHAQASSGDEALVFGGTNGQKYFKDLFEYRTQRNTVTLLDYGTGPSGRSGACAQYWERVVQTIDNTDGTVDTVVVRNATLVVFGGYDGKLYYNDLWMFDLSQGVWTQASFSNPPSPRAYHTCVTTGPLGSEELAVFGGFDGMAYNNDLVVLNQTGGYWFAAPNFSPLGLRPSPRAFIQGVFQGGDLYYFGGFDGSNCLADTWAYSQGHNSWFSIPTTNVPPSNAAYAGIHMEGGGYDTFGGFANCQATTNELYSLAHNNPNWVNVPAGSLLPPPRAATVGTRHGKDVFIYAGVDGYWTNSSVTITKIYDDLWMYVT